LPKSNKKLKRLLLKLLELLLKLKKLNSRPNEIDKHNRFIIPKDQNKCSLNINQNQICMRNMGKSTRQIREERDIMIMLVDYLLMGPQ
jgi:hypothetical protein